MAWWPNRSGLDGQRPGSRRPYHQRFITNDIDAQHDADYHDDAADPTAVIWQRPIDWSSPTCHLMQPTGFSWSRLRRGCGGRGVLLRLSYAEPADKPRSMVEGPRRP